MPLDPDWTNQKIASRMSFKVVRFEAALNVFTGIDLSWDTAMQDLLYNVLWQDLFAVAWRKTKIEPL